MHPLYATMETLAPTFSNIMSSVSKSAAFRNVPRPKSRSYESLRPATRSNSGVQPRSFSAFSLEAKKCCHQPIKLNPKVRQELHVYIICDALLHSIRFKQIIRYIRDFFIALISRFSFFIFSRCQSSLTPKTCSLHSITINTISSKYKISNESSDQATHRLPPIKSTMDT